MKKHIQNFKQKIKDRKKKLTQQFKEESCQTSINSKSKRKSAFIAFLTILSLFGVVSTSNAKDLDTLPKLVPFFKPKPNEFDPIFLDPSDGNEFNKLLKILGITFGSLPAIFGSSLGIIIVIIVVKIKKK